MEFNIGDKVVIIKGTHKLKVGDVVGVYMKRVYDDYGRERIGVTYDVEHAIKEVEEGFLMGIRKYKEDDLISYYKNDREEGHLTKQVGAVYE